MFVEKLNYQSDSFIIITKDIYFVTSRFLGNYNKTTLRRIKKNLFYYDVEKGEYSVSF